MTDLAMEREHLAKAERDLVEGEERIARQAELLARLREAGHDIGLAEILLHNLEQTLQVWKDHRDEILATLARLEKEQPTQ